MVAFTLLIVGGLNWLLVGLLNFDLVMWLFVDILGVAILAKIVYILVGLSAIYVLVTHCKKPGGAPESGASAGGGEMV